MTAEEIRDIEISHELSERDALIVQARLLREVAAQLADLNAKFVDPNHSSRRPPPK